MGILGLSAVCADEHIFVTDLLDDLKVFGQVALVFAAAHVLRVAAFQQNIVILDDLLLILHAHIDDPPLRMGDDQLPDTGSAGCIADDEAFFRRDMCSAKHGVIILDQLEDVLHLGNDFSVLGHLHAVVRVLAELCQMVLCVLGRQPDHFGSQLQRDLDRRRIQAADRMVQGDAAEHGKVVVAIDDLVITVAQISPVHCRPLMGLDDNGSCAHLDRGIRQLQIVIRSPSKIRIGVDVHIHNALHRIYAHVLPSFPS